MSDNNEQELNKLSALEQKFLAYCIQSKQHMASAMDAGVDSNWFRNEGHSLHFAELAGYFSRYKAVCPPSRIQNLINKYTGKNSEITKNFVEYHKQLRALDLDSDEFAPTLEDFATRHKKYLVKQAMNSLGANIDNKPIDDVLRQFNTQISMAAMRRERSRYRMKDICTDAKECVFDVVFDTYMNPSKHVGWELGLTALDDNFLFKRGRLHLVVGMTSQGKTTFARCCAMRMVARHAAKVLVISCEESVEDYFSKMAASCTNVPLYRMERGTLSQDELEILNIWSENPQQIIAPHGGWLKVLEVPSKEYSLTQIESIMVDQLGDDMPDVIVIDQLNLLAPITPRGDKNHLEFGDTSTYFRDMCKKYNVAGILLAQVGRSAVKNTKEKRVVEINIENIEGSNKPGQDCDLALAISTPSDEEGIMRVKCLKQRAGKRDWEVALSFHKETGNISNAVSLSMGPAAESIPAPVEREMITMQDSSGNVVLLNPETSERYEEDIFATGELPEARLPEDYDESQ